MKNITEILKEIGLEVPAEKKDAFNKVFFENYKTVAEMEQVRSANKTLEDSLAQRDKDLQELQKTVKDAGEASTKLAELQKKYDTEAEAHKKAIASQKYEFVCKELTNGIKFSSQSAKKAFTSDLIAKNLVLGDNDTLLGFDDFVKQYKETDSSAFVIEEGKTPKFSGKSGTNNTNNEEPKGFRNFW